MEGPHRVRALELAEDARRAFAELGPVQAPEVDRIGRWLREHSLD